MSVQPPNKTLPQDKDIVVSEPKVTGPSLAREQLSQVLDNFDDAIQTEISERIADVNEEEDRALIAEAYLHKLIEEERDARIAGDGGTGTAGLVADEAILRAAADTKLADAIYADRDPLNITLSAQSLKAVYVAPAYEQRLDPVSGDVKGLIVIPNGDDVSSFDGAHINFATGTINGVSSFTPINFLGFENEYSRYLLILNPNNLIEVRPSTEYNIDPTQAPYPTLATNGILVGSVVVRDDGTGGVGTIADIDPLTITYFKDSMGIAGSSAAVINTSPLEVDENELFTYYTKSDFQEDKSVYVNSTSGLNDIAVNNEVVLNVGQVLITNSLVGPQSIEDAFFINRVQGKILFKNGSFDKDMIVQFSKDGGATWTTAITEAPGSPDSLTYKGNLLIADLSFQNDNTTAFLTNNTPNASKAIGTSIGAVFTPTFNTFINAFELPIRTTATSGTVKGYLHKVISGVPQDLIIEASEQYTCGSDITSTNALKKFTFKPFVMEVDTEYAFVIVGTGMNASLEVDKTSSPSAYNTSSVTKSGGGWVPSGDTLCFKVYGSGYDLRMRMQSGTNLSKVAGFGVNYVSDTAFMVRGSATWEDRVVTSTEASTGTITLNQVVYTVGARQLHANIAGMDYFSPDFSETSNNVVQFPPAFLTTGQTVRFYNTYGIVDSVSVLPAGAQGPQGAQGPAGDTGAAGDAGTNGAGVAIGGTTGQVLIKASNTDYDTTWVDAPVNDVETNLDATTAPTSANDSTQDYSVGSIWLNNTTNRLYRASSVAVGAAVWELLNYPRNKNISALAIDWVTAETFWKDIAANTTFTFSNTQAGSSIVVVINNTSASAVTVTFPTGKKDSSYTGTIAANRETIYTILSSNSKIYISEYKDLV